MRITILALVLSMVACSGTKSDRGQGALDAQQACTDWAQALCDRINACSSFTLQFDYETTGVCVERNTPVCLGALAAAGTGATPASMESCSALYKTADCDTVVLRGKPPQGCTVAGSLAAGAACGDDSQCPGPNGYCKIDYNQTCGTCATLATTGDACASSLDCAYGLVCGLTCQVPVAIGGACDSSHFCSDVVPCADGVCTATLPLGASCDPSADLCDRDLGSCDAATNKCTASTTVAPGAPCTIAADAASCANSQCSATTEGAQGTCQPYASDGAACGTTGPYCISPAVCVGGICVVPDASKCH